MGPIRKTFVFVALFFLGSVFAHHAWTASKIDSPSPVLRVGVSPTIPPIIFKKKHAIVGLEADFAAELGAFLNRPIKFVEILWPDQIYSLFSDVDEVEIIMSGMSVTEPRKKLINFSRPYMKIGQMALVRREDVSAFEDPKGMFLTRKKIGVERETTGDYVVRQNFLNAKIVGFRTLDKAVRALKRKKVDIVVHDSPNIIWQREHDEENELINLAPPFTSEFLAWGVDKENVVLLDLVNEFLDEMEKTGRSQELIDKWVPETK